MPATPVITSTVRLKNEFNAKFRNELKKELNLLNTSEVPRLEKIVLNIGVGKAKDDKKMIELCSNTLRKITGQAPITTSAKRAIASFKLREGNVIGLKVTLRAERMYEFLDRLINIVLPRVRDFHGLSLKSFDRQGNYSIGLSEQSVFPELSFEDTSQLHGLQITIHISGNNPSRSEALLRKMGFPFEKPPKSTNEEKK